MSLFSLFQGVDIHNISWKNSFWSRLLKADGNWKLIKMSSAGGQFLLLLWKNFKLQGRKKCVTVFEIITPLFFALLLLFIRALADSEYINHDTTWDSFYPSLISKPATKTKLFFTPNNTFTNDIMSDVLSATNATGKPFIFALYQCVLLRG